MLSRQLIGAPQEPQCDRGLTIDSSLGMRLMQTFRKLPNANPATKSTHSRNGSKRSVEDLV